MAYAYKYARSGPPFNFLGHFSESQKKALQDWVTSKQENFAPIQVHHQIRAQQLRKSAGLLEKFYAENNDEKLETSFRKEPWVPGPDGHNIYAFQEDHTPMLHVSKVKSYMQDQLQRHDEAVFHMNHIRTLIEKAEDNAQYASEASDNVTAAMQAIEDLFNQPRYQAVLVKDVSEEPLFRVNQLDDPTPYEKIQLNHGGDVLQLKEPSL